MEARLKSILKTWGRFPADDEADFHCLVSEVTEALRHGSGEVELAMVIHNEFYNHFGTQGPKGDVNDVVEEILLWWRANEHVQ